MRFLIYENIVNICPEIDGKNGRESVKGKILGVNNRISKFGYRSLLLQGRKTIRMREETLVRINFRNRFG